MRGNLVGFLLTIQLAFFVSCQHDEAATNMAASPKSILHIIIDDLQLHGDLAGASPNMDKFASTATSFLHMYCQSPVCTVSRSSFLTGRRPEKFRVGGSFRDLETGSDWTTLPEYFRQNNYVTIGMGKTFHPGIPENWDIPRSWSSSTAPLIHSLNDSAVDFSDLNNHYHYHHHGDKVAKWINYEYWPLVDSGKKYDSFVEGTCSSVNKSQYGAVGRPACWSNKLPNQFYDYKLADKSVDLLQKLYALSPNILKPQREEFKFHNNHSSSNDVKMSHLKKEEEKDIVHRLHTPYYFAIGFHLPHTPWVVPFPFWNKFKEPKKNIKSEREYEQERKEEDIGDVVTNSSIADNRKQKLDPSITSLFLAPEQMPPLDSPEIAACSGEGCLPTVEYTDKKGTHRFLTARKDFTPWKPLDEETQSFLRGSYRSSIAFVDAQIGRVLDTLDKLEADFKPTDRAVVLIHSDHGLDLGDHGHWLKRSLYESCLRVPFLLRSPEHVHSFGKQVSALSELVDIMPTLIDLAHLKPISEDIDGVSLKHHLHDLKEHNSKHLSTAVSNMSERNRMKGEKENHSIPMAVSRYPRCLGTKYLWYKNSVCNELNGNSKYIGVSVAVQTSEEILLLNYLKNSKRLVHNEDKSNSTPPQLLFYSNITKLWRYTAWLHILNGDIDWTKLHAEKKPAQEELYFIPDKNMKLNHYEMLNVGEDKRKDKEVNYERTRQRQRRTSETDTSFDSYLPSSLLRKIKYWEKESSVLRNEKNKTRKLTMENNRKSSRKQSPLTYSEIRVGSWERYGNAARKFPVHLDALRRLTIEWLLENAAELVTSTRLHGFSSSLPTTSFFMSSNNTTATSATEVRNKSSSFPYYSNASDSTISALFVADINSTVAAAVSTAAVPTTTTIFEPTSHVLKSCEELEWKVDVTNGGDPHICSASQLLQPMKCFEKVNFTLAKETCEKAGARLCSINELILTEDSIPCSFPLSTYIWSSTKCDAGINTLAYFVYSINKKYNKLQRQKCAAVVDKSKNKQKSTTGLTHAVTCCSHMAYFLPMTGSKGQSKNEQQIEGDQSSTEEDVITPIFKFQDTASEKLIDVLGP